MTSPPSPIKILLISTDEPVSSTIREALAADGAFEMDWVERMRQSNCMVDRA